MSANSCSLPVSPRPKLKCMSEPKKCSNLNLGIAEWYTGQSILVTGGTGFVGKVLIEKLLRSCPGIGNIYLLIRFKKGKSSNERLEELKKDLIFSKLLEYNGDVFEKLRVINGDLSLPNLNITDADKGEICQNVSVIFHCGACVDIDAKIKTAIAVNTIGTKHLLKLSDYLHKLKAFVFLSNIYASSEHLIIDEIVYSSTKPASKIADSILSLQPECTEKLCNQILGSKQNNYYYSKALAEQLVLKQGSHLPVCIIRASLVTASLAEPAPGWIDAENGPTSVVTAIGKGVLRSVLGQSNYVAEIIPVDLLVNFMISAAWSTDFTKARVTIYNCTTGPTNPVTWGDFIKLVSQYTRKHPFNDVIRYPACSLHQSKMYHKTCEVLFQMIPSMIFDVGSLTIGRMPCMLKLQQNFGKSVRNMQYFTTHQWEIRNKNMIDLQKHLNSEDQVTFNFDVSTIKWATYFENYVFGVRKYILKESELSNPRSDKRIQRLYYIHRSCQLACMALTLFICTNPGIYNSARTHCLKLIDWYRTHDVDVPIAEIVAESFRETTIPMAVNMELSEISDEGNSFMENFNSLGAFQFLVNWFL